MARLSIEDRLKSLLPGWIYYPHKIAKEVARNEPELALLHEFVRPGCTAIDVGANRGFYSYALAAVAGRVEAFEPNPEMVAFNRAKARRNVTVHEVALSDREGRAAFYIPLTAQGARAHLLGNLGNVHRTDRLDRIEVRLATLDSFGFADVGFIKIDVEGAEIEVLQGACATIARDRPTLAIELLTRPDRDALAAVARIEDAFGYRGLVVRGAERLPARAALADARATIKSKNVLFLPR